MAEPIAVLCVAGWELPPWVIEPDQGVQVEARDVDGVESTGACSGMVESEGPGAVRKVPKSHVQRGVARCTRDTHRLRILLDDPLSIHPDECSKSLRVVGREFRHAGTYELIKAGSARTRCERDDDDEARERRKQA